MALLTICRNNLESSTIRIKWIPLFLSNKCTWDFHIMLFCVYSVNISYNTFFWDIILPERIGGVDNFMRARIGVFADKPYGNIVMTECFGQIISDVEGVINEVALSIDKTP